MASIVTFTSLLLFTFLAINNKASARDIPQQEEITFVQEPNESYYIVKKLPAEITCRARNAADIIFRCAGVQIPPSSIEVPETDLDAPEETQATIKVTRADVENSVKSGESYTCECGALDDEGQEVVTSRQAKVVIAYLNSKFDTHPTNVAAIEGEMAELLCVPPMGEPKPEVVWRKDTRRIEFPRNPRLQLSEQGSLIIKSVTPADAGIYQCVARNVIGRQESKPAALSVLALAEASEPTLEFNQVEEESQGDVSKTRNPRQSGVPQFSLEPSEIYYAQKDKNVTVDCGAVAADLITFRCNGVRIKEKVKTSTGMSTDGIKIIQAKLNLTYAEVESVLQSGQNARYQCVCVAWFMRKDGTTNNAWSQVESKKENGFIVLAGLDRKFKVEPADTTAGLNKDAVLKCEPPTGQPKPWVIWYKDRVRVDPRNSTKYSVNPKGHLTILSVQYEDAGAYSCQADNGYGTAQSRPGRLTVVAEAPPTTTSGYEVEEDYVPVFPDVIPDTPRYLVDFKPENFLGPDGTKKLTCAVISAEQITIDCAGSRLSPDEVTLKTETDRKSEKRLIVGTTVINAARLESADEDFFCQCTAWYLVNRSWNTLMGEKGYVKAAKVQERPDFLENKFEKNPRGQPIQLEDDVVLSCKPPAGKPVPTVYWLKDGKRIDPAKDPNYIVEPEGDLIIQLVRAIDEGTYICVAENTVGRRNSTEARLRFRERPTKPTRPTTTTTTTTTTALPDSTSEEEFGKMDEPFFNEEPQETNYLIDAEAISLKCSVVGATTNLVFACNGKVVRSSATTSHTIQLEQATLRENSLTVSREEIEEFPGNFTCKCRALYRDPVTNNITFVESKAAYLNLAFLDDDFNQEPENTEVTIQSTVTLPCIPPNSFPAPEILWEKDGQLVNKSGRVEIKESGSLVISSFDEADQGSYRCIARNIVGERLSRQVSIYIKGADEVIIPETKPTVESPLITKPEPTDTVTSSGVSYISKDLYDTYYVVKNKPAVISCEAVNVISISFKCNNNVVVPLVRDSSELSSSGDSVLVNKVEGSISVNKNDVESVEKYECQCFANYKAPSGEELSIASVKARVEIAAIKKMFQVEPEDKVVLVGEILSIQCKPPQGNPTPTVRWTKDGKSFEGTYDAELGNLLIHEAKLEDSGEYICIAENPAGSRSSRPALIEVKATTTASELDTTTLVVGEPGYEPTVVEGGEGQKPGHGDGDDYVTEDRGETDSQEGNKVDGKTDQKNCISKLNACTGLLAQEKNEFAKCSVQPQYDECLSDFIVSCSEEVSPEALESAELSKRHWQISCAAKQCQSLESCLVISSNLPGNSNVEKTLPIKEVCEDVPQFFNCVHGGLTECNVTLVPTGVFEQETPIVVDWITHYCNRLVLVSDSVASCEEMTKCDLEISNVEGNNVTYWCRLMNKITDCTAKAVDKCELEGLTQDLEWLSGQNKQCSELKNWPDGYPQPEVEPTPEGEPQPDDTADQSTKPDDNDDDSEEKTTEAGDNEGEIGEPEDPKAATGDENMSIKTSASFLAILLQLVLVAILSRR